MRWSLNRRKTGKMDYYATHNKTVANSLELAANLEETPHFPDEGICIGSLNTPNVQFPALIDLLNSKGFCFLYDSSKNREMVNLCLERIAWRLALCLPINQCEFLVYNGGSPGENFSSLNSLDKSLFRSSNKVLFDANSDEFSKALSSIYQEIATRITEIKESGKSNLFELNESKGNDPKTKYTFIFVSDYTNLKSDQKLSISKLVKSNCQTSGVFFFSSWDVTAQTEAMDNRTSDDESLLKNMTLLFPKDGRYFFVNSENDTLMNQFVLNLDHDTIKKNEKDAWTKVLHDRLEKNTVVSVDIRGKELTPDTLWSKSSKHGLEIPIGITFSTKSMNMEFCPQRDSTLVHGLIGGTSGSGKSTLLHDIIINSAWLYSPDELQFILLDFKSVEFGIYSGLPHVRVMSTKSDREYGANVLAYIVKEIECRKKLFGRVSSIEEYNDESHHVPRLLVVIDEFHNLFINNGNNADIGEINITSQIDKDFNKILKEGRSFGIHLLLATQEAGGIQSIDSYLQQIKLRIALKLDAKGKFLSFENDAQPERLKRGEGIYNDDFGKDGSNWLFRFTFYGDEVKTHKQVIETEMMSQIRKKSIEKYGTYSPCETCFYKGGGESTIEDNANLVTEVDDEKCMIYVGSPITVRREDVSFVLKRKRGSNILIVGSNSNYLDSLLRLTLLQTIRQSSSNSMVLMCDSSNNDSKPNCKGIELIESFNNNEGLTSVLQVLSTHLTARQNGEELSSNRIMFVLLGLRFFDVISRDDEVKNQMETIIIKGPEVGIHTILHSVKFADFEKAFQQSLAAFGTSPSITPDDMMREFDIKIELKGEDGYNLFSNKNRSASPQEEFIANIQTKDGGEVTRFSIYQQ